MSTSEEYHEHIGGYHEHIGGRSVHRGGIMSTSLVVQYMGNITSTSGDVQYISVFNINERRLSSCSPT